MSEQMALTVQDKPQVASVMEVIARASNDPNVDVAKMEALLNMQERLMKMQAEQQFNADLVALQAEVPRVSKDGRVLNKAGGVQSRYARYEDVDAAVRPLMNKYGFAISYDNPKIQGGVMEFTAELRHRTGHKKDYHLSLPVDSSGSKNGTQGGGSTTSYAKRYLLCSILNIVTEGQDNDGNKVEVITEDQLMTLETLIRDKRAVVSKILEFVGVPDLASIPAKRYTELVRMLEAKK